jgi:hypothetical protein
MNRQSFLAPVAVALAALISGSSAAAAPPVPVATPAQASAVAEAQRIGRDLYDFDQAAWGSTDALVAAMPDPGAAGVKGWIVERDADGPVAIYYGLRGDKPYKLFVAHMRGRSVTSSHIYKAGEDDAMAPIEQRMVAARAVALTPQTFARIGFQPCDSASLNSVVLVPATVDAPVSIYLLTPQTANDRYPFGGHYRVDIASDGSISGSRAFAKSCLAMSRATAPNGRPSAMIVTHLLEDQPTEIHVWLSLVANLPILVGTTTSRELWGVEKGKIQLLRALPEPASEAQSTPASGSRPCPAAR